MIGPFRSSIPSLQHLAFTRCGELNAYNVVEGQIAVIEKTLFGDEVLTS
jgi:hypothetical protein